MPELPEVETTKRELEAKVLKRTFVDVWTDTPKIIKKPTNFKEFKKEIQGKTIKKIWRRGKYIIFELSEDLSLLLHQKLTGHLLVGKWRRKNNEWEPLKKGPLADKINLFIHLMFWFDNGLMMALSDLRKFAKVELWNTKELKKAPELENLGPDPLAKDFSFNDFKELLKNKKGKIKQILMNQEIIAGIGNIYSDEILWRVKIHPLSEVSRLSEKNLKEIYKVMREVLETAIKLKGESISDYRNINGEKGGFDKLRKVYRREGEKCSRCGTLIKKIKMPSGRSSYFCPKCQKLIK